MDALDGMLARVSERVGTPEPKAADAAAPEQAVRPQSVPRKEWSYPGIFGATHVSTNFGEVPAHLIRARDRLRTRAGGFVQVERIDEYKLDDRFLEHQPDAKPIVIRSGMFGAGAPGRDAYFSPGQTILRPTTGVRHELVQARDMSSQQYAFDRSVGTLSYFVFHLPETALIRCEGIWVQVGG